MSNYKRSSRNQSNVCFSFSHSKKTSKQFIREGVQLTPAEQRGLVGWISSLLQPFERQFLHALQCFQKRNIVSLSSYITSNYPHLTDIVRYFIIGALIDFDSCHWNDDASAVPNSRNDVFLDMLIQELAGRFFRESKWFTKIMHIPIWELFAVLDTFSKGYITLRQLAQYSGKKIDIRTPSSMKTGRKLQLNLDGMAERIYQQNLREVQLRVDLTSFSNAELQDGQECSFLYGKIRAVLNQWSQGLRDERTRQEQLHNKQEMKRLQELEFSREDQRIRSISKSIVEGHKTPQKQKRDVQSVSQLNQNASKQPRSSFKPLSQTKVDERAKMTLEDIRPSPNGTFIERNQLDQLQGSRKMSFDVIDLQAQQKQRATQQHNKIAVRAAILSELQNIKLSKFRNRHRLCSYI